MILVKLFFATQPAHELKARDRQRYEGWLRVGGKSAHALGRSLEKSRRQNVDWLPYHIFENDGRVMSLIELITAEIQRETETTRRLLERVPEDSFAWKPHDKSMTLGQLASHVANLHGQWLGAALSQDGFDLAESSPLKAGSRSELLDAFDRNISLSVELLRTQNDEGLFQRWRLKRGEQVLFEMPRWAVLRWMVFNHIIHHRGQLSVYLRLRNVPLPPMYGPTADEAPTS